MDGRACLRGSGHVLLSVPRVSVRTGSSLRDLPVGAVSVVSCCVTGMFQGPSLPSRAAGHVLGMG